MKYRKAVLFAAAILLVSSVLFIAFPALKQVAHGAVHQPSAPAAGFLIFVNSTGDGGNLVGAPNCDADPAPGDQCTLRAAIQASNLSPGQDGIEFSIPSSEPNCNVSGQCVIDLTTPLPDITEEVEITGPGATLLTVRRNVPRTTDHFVIFSITASGETSISGLTVSNGSTSMAAYGSGIDSRSTGIVNLTGVAVTGNNAEACWGYAILNRSGTMNVRDSMVVGNCGTGISSEGPLTVEASTVSNNYGFTTGGIVGSTLNIINSTVSDNQTNVGSGGISGGEVNITNSTIIRNRAGSSAILQHFGGAGGVSGRQVILRSSIVALNLDENNSPSYPNLDGKFGYTSTSQGYNIIGSTDGAAVTLTASDQVGVTAGQLDLGPLQNNGGPTFTHAPGAGSAAIDRGTANGLITDQRGAPVPRTYDDPAVPNAPGGDGTDVGAFEVHPDTDSDGTTDPYDADDDSDGVLDTDDNCSLTINPDQTDTDIDGVGNACDADDDNDGTLDAIDNCPLTANADQADFDRDGIGDACDPQTGPPVDKEQCKNSGWMRFDTPQTFANENDCKKFIKDR